jgi:hypothetical protein
MNAHMRQPFEIYHDELIVEAKRRANPSPQGRGHLRELTEAGLDSAERAAACSRRAGGARGFGAATASVPRCGA